MNKLFTLGTSTGNFYIIVSALMGIIISYIVFFSGPSPEKMALFERECEKFFQDKYGRHTHIFDTWIKDGNTVFEVGYKNKSWDDGYSVRLCIIDEKKATISSPTPFNSERWRK